MQFLFPGQSPFYSDLSLQVVIKYIQVFVNIHEDNNHNIYVSFDPNWYKYHVRQSMQ